MANTKNPAEQNLKDAGMPDLALSDGELKKARQEGAKADAEEIAKDTHRFLTDGNLPNAPTDFRFHGYDEIQPWAHNLDLGEDALKERLEAKDEAAIPDNKAYGLLALERNGKNRTGHVKLLMKHLKLKADELPGGGPDYTNDTTNLSKL